MQTVIPTMHIIIALGVTNMLSTILETLHIVGGTEMGLIPKMIVVVVIWSVGEIIGPLGSKSAMERCF